MTGAYLQEHGHCGGRGGGVIGRRWSGVEAEFSHPFPHCTLTRAASFTKTTHEAVQCRLFENIGKVRNRHHCEMEGKKESQSVYIYI